MIIEDILNTNSVQRLRGLLSSRYGTGFKVDYMMDATSIEKTSHGPSNEEGLLCIPIFSGGDFLAQVKILECQRIPENEKEDVVQMVQMVLEPALKVLLLERSLAEPFVNVSGSNVIPFHNHNVETQESVDLDPAKKLISKTFIVETSQDLVFEKITNEIHHISERWAKFPFSLIKTEVQNAQDIAAMGPITLVVENVWSLSYREQKLVMEYLMLEINGFQPLVIFGTSTKASKIASSEAFLPEFRKYLKNVLIEAHRLPVETAKFKESMQLILEPLSGL